MLVSPHYAPLCALLSYRQGVIAEDAHIPLTQGGSSNSLHSTDAEQSLEISRISILARSSAKTSEKAESQKEKPRFAEFTIPHYQVIRFASAVLHSLLPKDILGSEANSKHLTIRELSHACAFMAADSSS